MGKYKIVTPDSHANTEAGLELIREGVLKECLVVTRSGEGEQTKERLPPPPAISVILLLFCVANTENITQKYGWIL